MTKSLMKHAYDYFLAPQYFHVQLTAISALIQNATTKKIVKIDWSAPLEDVNYVAFHDRELEFILAAGVRDTTRSIGNLHLFLEVPDANPSQIGELDRMVLNDCALGAGFSSTEIKIGRD